jgi:hypothetical protein
MKVTKLILLLSLLPFVLTMCKDDEPQYLGEFRLGAEGEAYIKFEPGSYWVYENDMTGERDSIVMEYYRSKLRHFQGLEREYYREDISFKWESNNGVYIFNSVHPFADLTPESAFQSNSRHWAMPCNKQVVGPSAIMHMPPTLTSGGGVSGQISTHRLTHDSLQVQGEWFYDVAVFEVDNDWIWNTFNTNHTKYYWAKNVGLIRRVLLEETSQVEVESYNLIKYQVTQ